MNDDKKTPSKTRPGRRVDVSPELREEILRLRPYYGARKIGERVRLSRKVVRRVLEEEGFPANRNLTVRSKLDPFLEQIAERVDKDLTATRILREIRNLGYEGGRTILSEYVKKLKIQRGLKPAVKVKRRFETRPGAEMQLDWSPYTVTIAGQPTKIHALGVILAYSRKLHYAVYHNERQPTLLEGMATGLPAVVTDTGGNPEVVVEGETGHLVPVGDHQKLGQALAGLLADPDRRRAWGDAARERVVAEFSFERMLSEYETVYDTLIRRR